MLLNKEDVKIIVGYIDELDYEQKRIVIMHIVNDMSLTQIADLLEYDEETVSFYFDDAFTTLKEKVLAYNHQITSLIPYLKAVYNEYMNHIDIDENMSKRLIHHISNDTLKYLEVGKIKHQSLITYDVIKSSIKFLIGVVVICLLLFAFHNVVDLEKKRTILELVQDTYNLSYVQGDYEYRFVQAQKKINDLYKKAKRKNDKDLAEIEKYLIHDDAIKYRYFLVPNRGFTPANYILRDFNEDGVRDLLLIYNLQRENEYYHTDKSEGDYHEMDMIYNTWYELLTIDEDGEVIVIWEYGFEGHYNYIYDLTINKDMIYVVRQQGWISGSEPYSAFFTTMKDVFSYENNVITALSHEEVDSSYNGDQYKAFLNYESHYDEYEIIKLEDIR